MGYSFRPLTFEEALKIKRDLKGIVYAGGTDLMVKRRAGANIPAKFDEPVIFIGHLDELKDIINEDNYLKIGSLCTQTELLNNQDIPGILKQAISQMSSPAIRNLGTIGGNICNASPAGDIIPVLYALEAVVVLRNYDDSREMPINQFITGPGKTIINPDEILECFKIPYTNFNSVYYKKVGTRNANALSKLSFVGLARIDDSFIKDIRISFGAVAPVVVKDKNIENILVDKNIEYLDGYLDKIVQKYAGLIMPIDDQRSEAEYRKNVSINILKDYLTRGLFL